MGGGLKDHEMGAFDYETISYVKDMKKQMNFSYMQSLALCAAFITGMNKESTDLRIFDRSNKQNRLKNSKQSKKTQAALNMVGKSKRFSLERYAAVLDYLVSTQAENA